MNKKDFLSFIPIAGTLIIFIGLLKQRAYYDHFNINILNYIETNEIISSMMVSIYHLILSSIAYLSLLLLVCGEALFTYVPNSCEENLKKPHQEVKLNEDEIKQIEMRRQYFKKLGIFNLFGVVIAILFVIFYLSSLSFPSKILINISTHLFHIYLIHNIIYIYFKRNNAPSKFAFEILWAINLLFIILISNESAEAFYVKEKIKRKEVSFMILEKEFKTNEYFYFIGQTSSHLFFYNDLEKRSEVYPLKDVSFLYFYSSK